MAGTDVSVKARRVLDMVTASACLLIFGPFLLLLALLVKLTSRGPVLHWSSRIGVNNTTFIMPKFRTMRTDAPVVATHLLIEPRRYLTPIGGPLRRFHIDELPQLVTILKGDLTFVGPRPALYSQLDLVELRTRDAVHELTPGLTGWAQVNGRATLTVEEKAQFDRYYSEHRSLLFDLKIVLLTVPRIIRGNDAK